MPAKRWKPGRGCSSVTAPFFAKKLAFTTKSSSWNAPVTELSPHYFLLATGICMIDLCNVTKRYGSKTAVSDLNLHIGAGELFAFLGPNGAGKTTTIKLMCGLLFPTSGTVRVGGFDVQADGDQARQLIAFVPDTPFLYEKLTGREFLQFIADMYGMPPDRGR